MTQTTPKKRPNILILVEDQWQTHMELPEDVPLPALRRLEAQGVSFDRTYCTVPMCTPSRATMWTGQHAVNIGMWDNTNFAWTAQGLSPEVTTVGHMLRDEGYYTALKGKWHVSEMPRSENALEKFGFSDVQQWGEMYGAPMQGIQLDHAAAFEAIDWLENKGSKLEQPWMLIVSLVNPHDVMFMVPDESISANGGFAGTAQHPIQTMPFFQKQWDIKLPKNFAVNDEQQPGGVQHYREYIDLNFGRIPGEREDLWLKQRNYLVNCMRLVDMEFNKILDTLDRLKLWDDTIVIYTGDHGEMNGAHQLTQKGGIHYDEAAVVPLIACVPGGVQGKRTGAVASLVDLVPTIMDFAGVSEEKLKEKHPKVVGRSLRSVIENPEQAGPRGSGEQPGDGVLVMWDALHSLDHGWAEKAGNDITDLEGGTKTEEEVAETVAAAGAKYGAPDLSIRGFMRYVVDGHYKLVRYFSPNEYGNPASVEELFKVGDIGMYDLKNDPGEMENIAGQNHPGHNAEALERLTAKLHKLVADEIGEDTRPFDPAMFGEEFADKK